METISDAHQAFGNEVRRLRVERGWSLEEFGHRVGLHPTYISAIERGERNLGLTNILRLGQSLDVSSTTFIRAAEKSNPSPK